MANYYQNIYKLIVPNEAMFIRIKRIKNAEYAYLVQNTWVKQGPKQKVKKYLGKVMRPEISKNMDFNNYRDIKDLKKYVEENTQFSIIRDLVDWELAKHGLDKKSLKKQVMAINEGYLRPDLLNKLTTIQITSGEYEDQVALAKAFVDAGIAIPQELFVAYFQKQAGM